MEKKKRILVCPLDWGLGHATRCIPIIRELERQGAEVIIAADKQPLKLLKIEFPTHEFVAFPGYDITYPANGNMAVQMLRQLTRISRGIYREHQLLKDIIKRNRIDGVISDNRYGLWSKVVPCVFITHQVMIKCPGNLQFLEPIMFRFSRSFIRKYTFCWIPDNEGADNLSGDLSHKYPLPDNASFIGLLSRFNTEDTTAKEIKNDLLVLLSGPEPQRTVFEKLILHQLTNSLLKVLLVRGIPDAGDLAYPNKNVDIKSHLNAVEMQEAILQSGFVISRPGYSTLMDLVTLNKRAAFVPTPGQTEQIYLASYHQKKGFFYYQSQPGFNLEKLLVESLTYKGLSLKTTNNILNKNITKLLDKMV